MKTKNTVGNKIVISKFIYFHVSGYKLMGSGRNFLKRKKQCQSGKRPHCSSWDKLGNKENVPGPLWSFHN